MRHIDWRKLLLVVDVQNDFINDNTKKYVDKIEQLINSNKYEYVAFTKFINNKNSIWYKKLNYKGCMTAKGKEIVINTRNYKVFEKTTYSALNKKVEEYIKENDIKEIYLCGFDTDACVQKTALDLFENGYEVFILKDYCMSSFGIELHNTTINNLKRLIGKDSVV